MSVMKMDLTPKALATAETSNPIVPEPWTRDALPRPQLRRPHSLNRDRQRLSHDSFPKAQALRDHVHEILRDFE